VPDVPYRVLFVCMGNICRSPMAESVFRAKIDSAGLGDRVDVDSAGTGGWHLGEPADPRAAAVLGRRGYVSTHAARKMRSVWLDQRDLVVVMDAENLADLTRLMPDPSYASKLRLLRSFDPGAREPLDLPDPYYGAVRDFESVLDMVETATDGLLDHVRGELDLVADTA
jgi:protein-tyrosine phosphatase